MNYNLNYFHYKFNSKLQSMESFWSTNGYIKKKFIVEFFFFLGSLDFGQSFLHGF